MPYKVFYNRDLHWALETKTKLLSIADFVTQDKATDRRMNYASHSWNLWPLTALMGVLERPVVPRDVSNSKRLGTLYPKLVQCYNEQCNATALSQKFPVSSQ